MTSDEIKQKLAENREKILKELEKKNLRYIDTISRTINGREYTKYLVAFQDKKGIKLGYIDSQYHHRYGIDVWCVKKLGKKYPWFQSNAYKDSISDELIDILEAEDIGVLPKFNLNNLTTVEF